MKIEINSTKMDQTKIHNTNDYHGFSEPYNPQKESFRWISASDLMSLRNILENYKYHTLKEIEDIISDSQNIFEISNRSNILLEIEDGLEMISNCFHPTDSEKVEEERFSTSSEGGEDSEKKDDALADIIKDIIIDKIYQNKRNKGKVQTLFANPNPELVKKYQEYMARNIFTNTDGDKDDNQDL